jgi:sugar/nucleoside kinase (ribokinase family)
MPEILTAGEILVEIMRKEQDVPLDVQGDFYGPFPSGAPAIFIDQAACLGHESAIIGAVGKDEFGEKTLRRLDLDGVELSFIGVHEEFATAVAFVSYRKDGSRKFLYHIPHAAAGHLSMPKAGSLKGVKIFHVMGCSLMVSPQVREIILATAKVVKKNGGFVSFDPNLRMELLKSDELGEVIGGILDRADILLPGEKELLQITGKGSIEDAAAYLFDRNVSALVVKRGRQGALLMDGSGTYSAEPIKIREIDPTGAGDAFDAGFVCGYLEGLGPERCLVLANACGALNASYFGPMEGVFNRNYVEYFMRTRA